MSVCTSICRCLLHVQGDDTLPKLISGKVGIPRSEEGVRELVIETLNWKVDDCSLISVSDTSGLSGSRTYKVSMPGMQPVVVHLRNVQDPLCEQRLASALKLFSKHGLAPQRLAAGAEGDSDWWIESFEGVPVGDSAMQLRTTAPSNKLRLTFVPEDSSDKITLENFRTLRASFEESGGSGGDRYDSAISSEEVALTLTSHPGLAIVLEGADFDIINFLTLDYHYIRLEIGDASKALHAKFDGHFLTSGGAVIGRDGFVSHWKRPTKENDKLRWLKVFDHDNEEGVKDETRRTGMRWAREFTIREDGSVALVGGTNAGHFSSPLPLVLGARADDGGAATFAEVGALLARVHQLPTEWYDEWRAASPGLEAADDDSPIWISPNSPNGKVLPQEVWAAYTRSFAPMLPVTAAGRRLVTCHGDLHPLNILRKQDGGLCCIDLEDAHVGRAADDLGFALQTFCIAGAHRSVRPGGDGAQAGRELVRGYLEQMEDPAGDEDVDALLLDVHAASIAANETDKALEVLKEMHGSKGGIMDASAASPVLVACSAIVADSRSDAALREEIFTSGLRGTYRGAGVDWNFHTVRRRRRPMGGNAGIS